MGFGSAVAGGFDLNRDGTLDVLIGAPRYNRNGSTAEAGASYVFLGPFTDPSTRTNPSCTLKHNVAYTHFGTSLAVVGDVDTDGTMEFLVGAPDADASGSVDIGKAYLYHYCQTAGSPEVTLQGEAAGDHFGFSVARARDFCHRTLKSGQ